MKNLGIKTKPVIFSLIAICAAALIFWRVANPSRTAVVPHAAAVPKIAFEKFTLNNGLTVIVHEDHRSTGTAINLWYHVGTKNERPDSHGIAHLSEHLMFTGTPRISEDVAKVLKRMGITNATASTDSDRTRVMMDVPEASFEGALRLVAELMTGTAEALTESKVDTVRRQIEQEVARVTHGMSVDELASVGRDVECQALARAVRYYVERRVFLNGQKTVVFR